MRLSENLQDLFAADDEGITFRSVLDRVTLKGFGILLTILALPSALPMPAPGYSVPFGIAILFLGFQMLMDREYPWFPERVLNKKIRSKKNSKLVASMVRFVSFFEKFIKPRLSFLYRGKISRRMLGAVVLCCGASMCIPIPLTNTAPALGVFLIGFGSIEEDGLIGLAGVCVAAAGLALTLTVLGVLAYFSFWAVGSGAEMDVETIAQLIKDFIKGMLGADSGAIVQ